MVTMRELMKPGVMLSNIWPRSRETEGATLCGLEEAVGLGFFEGIQVVDIPFPEERRRFSEVLKENGLQAVMAMTRILNLNHLNLSSHDAHLRRKSVDTIVGALDQVREAGVAKCTVVSGARPEAEAERKDCLAFLMDSLDRLCEAAEETPALEIQIEPLDYFAHKRMTLGSTGEAVELAKDLALRHKNFSLCLDTAHMCLNGENLVEGMREGKEFLTDFHFCNPCLEKNHESFGDNHLLFGSPGALTSDDVVDLMVEGSRVGLFTEDLRPTVSFEIQSSDRMRGSDLLRHCRDLFEECWEKAASRIGE